MLAFRRLLVHRAPALRFFSRDSDRADFEALPFSEKVKELETKLKELRVMSYPIERSIRLKSEAAEMFLLDSQADKKIDTLNELAAEAWDLKAINKEKEEWDRIIGTYSWFSSDVAGMGENVHFLYAIRSTLARISNTDNDLHSKG